MGADDHTPVLALEVCEALEGTKGVLVDATGGLGGHTEALLSRMRPQLAVLFDRDPDALAVARRRLSQAPCPVHFVQAPFSTLAQSLAELDISEVAAIVADLGVSSLQLARPERGFSLRADGPLDMRMDASSGTNAAELLATIDAGSLSKILREYGEEPDARRIASAIVHSRPTTTMALAQVVATAMSARERRRLGRRIHPATRTFMALRIHVNNELGELDSLLDAAPGLLVVGGRLAVITFHSLEDRRVKRAFRSLSSVDVPDGVPLTEAQRPRAAFEIPRSFAGGVTPSEEELSANPRSRSARLRVLERISA